MGFAKLAERTQANQSRCARYHGGTRKITSEPQFAERCH
jgi:hypothetical protein